MAGHAQQTKPQAAQVDHLVGFHQPRDLERRQGEVIDGAQVHRLWRLLEAIGVAEIRSARALISMRMDASLFLVVGGEGPAHRWRDNSVQVKRGGISEADLLGSA